MTKTTTSKPYTGENPFANNGVELTLVSTWDGLNIDVRVEAHRYGVRIGSASHPNLLWDQIRKELGR